MRRRALLSMIAVGAAGLAGCAGQTDEPGSNTTDPETSKRPVTSSQPHDDATGTDKLSFADEIGQQTRTRCRRALERTASMMGASLSEPIEVETVEPRVSTPTLPLEYGIIAMRAPWSNARPPTDSKLPGALGYYDASKRVLSLADPDELPETVFDDTEDVPEFSFTNYPNEPFLAHELAHAIQHDATAVASLPDRGDARAARQGVVEGTTEYIRSRYRTACSDGEFDTCTSHRMTPDNTDVPLWFVPRRLPYVNGMAFAYEAVQRGGWELLWQKHRSPPKTTAEVMFPDLHFEADVEVADLDPHPKVEGDWNRTRYSRLGVNALYFKLRAHGIAGATDADAAVDRKMTAATGIEYVYRDDLLREWRGDHMTLYVNDRRRAAAHWKTQWASTEAARTIADGVTSKYQQQATADGDGWEVGPGFATVDRTGATVTFGYAPSRTAMQTVLDAN